MTKVQSSKMDLINMILIVFSVFCTSSTTADTSLDARKLSFGGDLILGLVTGEIARCDMENVRNCSKIYERMEDEDSSPILSLVPFGEFIFLGSEAGEIRRCVLADKVEDCTVFHKAESEVHSLVIEGDFLYAGLSEGMLKCLLRKSKCTVVLDEITPVYSLVAFEEDMFLGSEELILRCPLKGDFRSHCSVVSSVGSAVTALGCHESLVYAALRNGKILRCGIAGFGCDTVFSNGSEVKAMTIHGGQLFAASLSIISCNLSTISTNNSCTASKTFQSEVLSLASVYKTIPMMYYFENEHKKCSWQGRRCPPFIIYYDEEDRAPLELKVKDSKVYFAGRPLNTSYADFSHSGPKAIFVMDATGRIFVSNQHPFLLLHHSSLIAGNYVASAGEISALNGEIKSITTCSGHYRPSIDIGGQVLKALERKGYYKNVKLVDCSKLRLFIDLEYNKLDLYYKVLALNVTEVADLVYKDGFE